MNSGPPSARGGPAATEIGSLTGFKTPARQVEWLRSKGWRFEINVNRRPIMARGYTEKMLGCGAPEEVVLKPNFSALKDRNRTSLSF